MYIFYYILGYHYYTADFCTFIRNSNLSQCTKCMRNAKIRKYPNTVLYNI